MSRRARLEAERLKHLNDELQEEENRLKAQKDRIYAPIIWRRLGSGIKIQDLKKIHHDQVLNIIEECYFQEELLCRNTNLGDEPDSVKSFLDFVIFCLKDGTSIIALEENNEDRIAGFLILQVIRKANHDSAYNRSMPIEGEARKKCSALVNHLSRKADIFGTFECEMFLNYHLLCIVPTHRHRTLGYQLMEVGIEVARSLNIPVVAGTFSTWSLQKLATKTGMKLIFEVNYVDWRDRFGELIFEEPGVGNYTCAVMAGPVPPLVPPETLPPKSEEDLKLTREDKRKLKAKAAKKKS